MCRMTDLSWTSVVQHPHDVRLAMAATIPVFISPDQSGGNWGASPSGASVILGLVQSHETWVTNTPADKAQTLGGSLPLVLLLFPSSNPSANPSAPSPALTTTPAPTGSQPHPGAPHLTQRRIWYSYYPGWKNLRSPSAGPCLTSPGSPDPSPDHQPSCCCRGRARPPGPLFPTPGHSSPRGPPTPLRSPL